MKTRFWDVSLSICEWIPKSLINMLRHQFRWPQIKLSFIKKLQRALNFLFHSLNRKLWIFDTLLRLTFAWPWKLDKEFRKMREKKTLRDNGKKQSAAKQYRGKTLQSKNSQWVDFFVSFCGAVIILDYKSRGFKGILLKISIGLWTIWGSSVELERYSSRVWDHYLKCSRLNMC